jgi:hypothetical protein
VGGQVTVQSYKLSGATDKIADGIDYEITVVFAMNSTLLDNLTKQQIKLGDLDAVSYVRNGPSLATVTFTLPELNHTYTNSVLQKDATHHWLECDAADCPDKVGSIKDKAEHSASTPATCVAKATCACGLEIGELGTHNFATDAWKEEVPATCVATGTKAHKDCSVCHKHFAADGVTEITDLTIAIDTTNHDMATEWTKTADGHYYACKRTGCEHHGEVYAHNPDKAAATETESVNCSVCGYVITPALGATPDTEPGTTPGTDDPNTPDDPTDGKDGLGAGAIVGIVIGSVLVVGVGGFALVWFVIKKKTWAEFLAIFKKG